MLSDFKHFLFFAESFLLFCELCEASVKFSFAIAELVLSFCDFGIESFAVFEEIFLQPEFLITSEAFRFALGLLEDFIAGLPCLSSDHAIEKEAYGRADGSGEGADEQIIHGLFPEV